MQKEELLNISPEEGKVYFFSEIWDGKDRKFMQSWCKNIFNYTKIKYPEDFNNSKLDFYDVQSNRHVASLKQNCLILF